MIETILDRMNEYAENSKFNFFIMEPLELPLFLQVAKIGEEFILDVPAANFYDPALIRELFLLMETKYRKKIQPNEENEKVVSYQIRFSNREINKMCYICQDILMSLFKVDKEHKLSISMR